MSAVVGVPRHCSVEDVKLAISTQYTARVDPLILGDIESHTQAVQALLHRKFYPVIDTRYFNWPYLQYAWPETLHLAQHELISVTQLTSGGNVIPPGNYQLEPRNEGPPYDQIELDLSTSSAFGGSAGTWQWNIAVTGVFGACNSTVPGGALAAGINDTVTTLTVTDSSLVGVGPAILIDSEYMTVEAKAMASTGTTIGGNLAVSQAGTTVPVADGTKINAGETILIDAERMLVTDIAGNNALVKRAYDGTVLAAHTSGATVYAPRTLTVVRGCWGTTPASHSTAAAVLKHQVPALVRDLTVAEVVVHAQWMSAGGTDVIQRGGVGGTRGKGTAQTITSTDGIRQDTIAAWGRQARTRSV
jgi:hypothetical protein